MSAWKPLLLGAMIFAAGAAFGQCEGETIKCPEVKVICPGCPDPVVCPDPVDVLNCPDCPPDCPPIIEIPITITPTTGPAFKWDVGVHALFMEDTNGATALATWNGRRPHRFRPTFGVAWLEGRDINLTTPQLPQNRCCQPTFVTQPYPVASQWGFVAGVAIGIGRN